MRGIEPPWLEWLFGSGVLDCFTLYLVAVGFWVSYSSLHVPDGQDWFSRADNFHVSDANRKIHPRF